MTCICSHPEFNIKYKLVSHLLLLFDRCSESVLSSLTLWSSTFKTEVVTLFTSCLDHCNAIFTGCLNSSLKILQLIQNAAAWVLTGAASRNHISPMLASLHWFPAQVRIEFKILMIYKALNGKGPLFLKDFIVPFYPLRALSSKNADRSKWYQEPFKLVFQSLSHWTNWSNFLRQILKYTSLKAFILNWLSCLMF